MPSFGVAFLELKICISGSSLEGANANAADVAVPQPQHVNPPPVLPQDEGNAGNADPMLEEAHANAVAIAAVDPANAAQAPERPANENVNAQAMQHSPPIPRAAAGEFSCFCHLGGEVVSVVQDFNKPCLFQGHCCA